MSQERVYQALRQAGEAYLSGQQLSAQLGITRAAVWKAVEGLRRQGCVIEAKAGAGYRLRQGCDRLTTQTVAAALSAPRDRWQVLAEVDSTNSACRRLALEGAPDGTVVMADCQTAGRGRRGRSFQSPRGLGLFLSVLWRPECTPQALLPLTALSAVAVCRAIEQVTGVRPQIKWPNDLVLQGRKLAGILTELALESESGMVDHVVVGIGVNVHQQPQDFSPDVRRIATSLDSALQGSFDRAALAAAMMQQLDILRREVMFCPELWLEEYRQACLNLGRRVRLVAEGNEEQVTAVGVDNQFGLTVRHDDGRTETVRSGEVSVRGLYGYTE